MPMIAYIKMRNNYYQKHKEKLWKRACEKYNLSEEEKDKRQEKTQDRYIINRISNKVSILLWT